MRKRRSKHSLGKLALGGLCTVLLALAPVCLRSSENLGGVVLLNVKPRVITPNGDQSNDKAFFNFSDSLSGLPVETSILDISGAKVCDMQSALSGTALTWDGRDQAGRLMPPGIYIYSIKIGKNQATGTLVVAK